MKCPRCDTDITDKRECSKCGLDVAGSQDEIEVEYKDFKTAELLEIRHKKQTVHEHEKIITVREHKGEKAVRDEATEKAFYKEEKKPFPFLAALALTLIAGAFFIIFRYFIMR